MAGLPDVPVFLGTDLPETQRRLQEFLDNLQQAVGRPPNAHGPDHLQDGVDPIPGSGSAPLTVTVGGSSGVGDGPGFMNADAQLTVSAGSPVAVGLVLADGVSSSAARADHVHTPPVGAFPVDVEEAQLLGYIAMSILE